MEDVNELQLTCFQIIGFVGTAKSDYITAISKAREGAFDEAEKLVEEGDEAFRQGHDVHMKLLQADAAGEREPNAPLILLHAEDQMAGTEIIKVMTTELMTLYKKLHEKGEL